MISHRHWDDDNDNSGKCESVRPHMYTAYDQVQL